MAKKREIYGHKTRDLRYLTRSYIISFFYAKVMPLKDGLIHGQQKRVDSEIEPVD